jgi:hypothetical protein
MTIIAQQGKKAFLVQEGIRGTVVDLDAGKAFPSTDFQSILARGYWEEPGPISEAMKKKVLAMAEEQL